MSFELILMINCILMWRNTLDMKPFTQINESVWRKCNQENTLCNEWGTAKRLHRYSANKSALFQSKNHLFIIWRTSRSFCETESQMLKVLEGQKRWYCEALKQQMLVRVQKFSLSMVAWESGLHRFPALNLALWNTKDRRKCDESFL